MTPDDRLKQALGLGAEEPPSVDVAFTARVIEGVARRRFLAGLGVSFLWAGVTALVCWALAPALEAGLSAMTPAFQPMGIAGLVVVTALILSRADLVGLARRAAHAMTPPRI